MSRSRPADPPAPRELAVTAPPESTSRYELLEKIAAGGMATVYVGRQRGAEGFWRLVAIKRPHQHLLDDPAFRRMFVEEARLASRIHHPHVVPVLDVEERSLGQLLLVMDYIEGASLAELMDEAAGRGAAIPARVAVRIALDALAGLHAAHELTDAGGRPLRLVHRDVSPHNILVGVDGTSRVADFGIAKSIVSKGVTESGVLKGKLAYMAPEYVTRQVCDARSDVFGMAVVTWEALAGQRLFRGESDYDTLKKIVDEEAPRLSVAAAHTSGALDAVLAAALERDAALRTPTARAFAEALEAAARRVDLVATTGEVSDYLRSAMATPLGVRRERLRRFLDAGGTTGPMVSAEDPRASDPSGSAAAPAASGSRPVLRAASAPPQEDAPDEAPISVGMTSVGSAEATERALVAAGIRPRKRSSGLLVAAALAVALGGGSAFWLFGTRTPTHAPTPGSVAADGALAPSPSQGNGPTAPRVEPIPEPLAAPPPTPSSEPSAAAPRPALSAPLPPGVGRPKVGASPAPGPTAAPAPPPTAPGPIRENPYR